MIILYSINDFPFQTLILVQFLPFFFNADIFIQNQQFIPLNWNLLMINHKIILLFLHLLFITHTFYFSKNSIPTLYLNQETIFNISHNGGDIVQLRSSNLPDFMTLLKNGTLTIIPKNEGSFQFTIDAIDKGNNQILSSISHFVIVFDKKKQIQKPLWIIDQQNYYQRTTERPLVIETDGFDFHAPVYTNQNIRLNLKCKNAIGAIKWIFQGLPQTMRGNSNTGSIIGYVQTQGYLIIRTIAIDSLNSIGQINIFLKFNQYAHNVNLSGQTTYLQYDYKSSILKKQKLQNAGLLQNQIKYFLNKKSALSSKRLQVLNTFRNISLFRQQLILDEQVLSQQIVSKTNQSDSSLNQLSKMQKQLQSQKVYVQKLRKILGDKQKDYSTKLQQNQNLQSMRNLITNQSQKIKKDFQSIKNQISDIQNQLFNIQTNLKDTQFQRSRQNVSYISMQKQEVRTRQILEIRKTIQLQYLIKKAQTDNKVLRTQDYTFLAQSNYDAAYSRYKSSATEYIQLSIQSKYLGTKIQQAIADYNAMNQTISKLKLNYAISLGNLQTLNTAKQQLNRLSNYVVKSLINSTSNTSLTSAQIIDKQTNKEIEQYPFTGCKKIGNFAWAGSGRIKLVGTNSIILTSQQVLNFGRCTKISSNLSKQSTLSSHQWIQYTGYYWDGAIQADSLTLISQI